MCGIVGVISQGNNGFSLGEQKTFENLLYMDNLRGEDATGIAVVTRDHAVHIAKAALDAPTISYTTEYKDIIELAYKEGKVAIGHNRKKTIGASIDENAHPFIVDDEFVFVHNGTLNSYKHLTDKTVDVDSEALAIHIHKHLRTGKEDAIDEALSNVYGAYACVFYDQITEKLYMFRNNDRPLFLISLKNGGYVFSSEAAIGWAAASRNYLQVESTAAIEVNHLYTFDLSKVGAEKPHVRKLKEKSSFFPQAPISVGAFHGQDTQKGTSTTTIRATGHGGIEQLSKNGFKRFQKRYLYRKVAFTVEDFCERNPSIEARDLPADSAIDWISLGRLVKNVHEKESYYPNTVQSILTHATLSQIIDLGGTVLFGVVDSIDYDAALKRAIVTINKVDTPKSDALHEVPAISLQ